MNALSGDKSISFVEKHPFLTVFAAFLFCVVLAKGDSALMNPADLGILMGGLALVLMSVSGMDAVRTAVMTVLTGGVFGLASLLVEDYDTVLTFGGAAIIIAVAVYLKTAGKLDHGRLILLILIFGFWLQLCYSQYTACTLRQNDVGFFGTEVFDPHHAGYISYIRYYGWIPYADVRTMDQWYHPPFHHLICAYFLRLYGMVFPKYAENWEILQMVTLIWSFLSVVFIRRIIKLFDISDRADTLLTLLLATFPIFIINAGELNNDILSVMLFVMSVYFIFRWFREGYAIRYLVGSAVTIGLGMMTKLSCWMAAVPVGTVLLASLIRTKGKDIKMWCQYGLFGIVSLPLGLWFPIRNYLGWGVPPSYIPVPLYDESLEGYSVWLRLFDVIDNRGYYNIPYFALWSAVFDDDDYRSHVFFGVVSFIVFAVFAILVIIALCGVIYMVVRMIRKKEFSVEITALVLMLIVELVSYTVFCFKFPYICTMNFRYIIPVTVTFALGLGMMYDRLITDGKYKPAIRGIEICSLIFAFTSAVFYLSLWGYDNWLALQNM